MKDATQFHIRPARPEEAGLFYAQHPEENKRLGAVGCVRMDFGRSGNEFWHTWWPRGPEELNSPVFKAELQQIVGKLREDVLKNRFAMERFCYDHGGKIDGGYVQNYGYIVETERYRYCLRCNPSPGDYNGYLTAYDLAVQRQNTARDKPLVGRVSYANGDAQDFTDAEVFLKCVREELPYRPTTGLRYEVLTDDPAVRKAVDDIVFDLYGDLYERNEYGDLDDCSTLLEGRELREYQDQITAALVKNRMPEEAERGIMHWYDEADSVDRKVRSAVFTVEERDRQLWGVAECCVAGKLSDTEMDTLKEFITGQASDGWCEGFEQREIAVDDGGELYVHFWNSDQWSIQTEQELFAPKLHEQNGMKMGWMTLG